MFVCKFITLFLAGCISKFLIANVDGTGSKPTSFSPGASSSTSSSSQNQRQIAHILELSDDLQHEYFDRLELKELASIGNTSTKLNKVATDFFQKHFYGPVLTKIGKGSIYSYGKEINIDCFSKVVRSIFLNDGDLQLFEPNRFNSLKEIEFSNYQLIHTDYAVNVLPNVESLKFAFSKLNGNFHEIFLSHCEKLQRLYVGDNNLKGIIIGTSNNWLTRKYSSLKHLEIYSLRRIDAVIEFLKENRNISKFSTTIDFLMTNYDTILNSGIKLDVLCILRPENIDMTDAQIQMHVRLLIKFQEIEFFKYLHLYGTAIWMDNFPSSLLHCIQSLHLSLDRYSYDISSLVNLKELFFVTTDQIINFDASFPKLQKLEYIFFRRGQMSNILSIIKCLPKLSKIQFENLSEGTFNLLTINNERAKLPNANKLTIYVPEEIYLFIKKSLNQIDFDFIKIQRFESYYQRFENFFIYR